MMHKIKTATIALVFGIGSPAFAGEPGKDRIEKEVIVIGGPAGAGGMDGDGDGAVTRAEFDAMHARLWNRLDRNGDGKLSDGEFGHSGAADSLMVVEHGPDAPGDAGRRRHDVRILRHGEGEGGLDAHKDGRVSIDELTAPLREHFQRADRDQNGFLDREEMGGDGERVIIRRTETRR